SPADGRVGSSELMTAVTEACEPVKLETITSPTSTNPTGAGSIGSASTASESKIYDCAGKASALAAQ
ncbi:MAG TPA: hypothetical protein PKA56_12595, partial [Solirubrobacterales bacterium]|nr:hypothetical protein [Solirubrobacterales bacterium]